MERIGDIIGWEGAWDYTEEESPKARRLTLQAGRVLDKSGAQIGTYATDGDRLTITFEPTGDVVADRLTATRADNLCVANGYRAYSFADDIPESEGGTGPLTVIAKLVRIRPA